MVSTYRQLQKDLHRGKEGEDRVMAFLSKIQTNGCGEVVNVGKDNPHWDLENTGHAGKFGRTFEVKTDDTSQRTGNFYLEVWSNRGCKNAGCIPNCKADTLVIISGPEMYFLDRGLFYSWVFENLFLNTKIAEDWRKRTNKASGNTGLVAANNNKDVQGVLIPLKHIKESIALIDVIRGE